MGRRASVRYWPSRSAYCCEYKGKLVVLAKGPDDQLHGTTYQAALKAFGRLIDGHAVPVGKTYSAIWDAYIKHKATRLEPKTITLRKVVLLPFLEVFGDKLPEQVPLYKIEEWVHSKRQPRMIGRRKTPVSWGDGTVRTFWVGLRTMIRWAIRNKMVAEDPTIGVEIPAEDTRADCVIEPDEHRRILASEKSEAWRDFWTVLEATGARPGEIAAITAADFDPKYSAIVYKAKPRTGYKHKNARHGKTRIIYLTGEALEVVKRRMVNHPVGPIFGASPLHRNIPRPGEKLKPWNAQRVTDHASKVRQRTGIKFMAYAYRHTFATRWLLANRSVEKLAVLIGSSPKVIHQHYSHLLGRQKELREELEAFQAERTPDIRHKLEEAKRTILIDEYQARRGSAEEILGYFQKGESI